MLLKLTPFTNVVANQTATLDLLALTKGRVLDRVILLLGGTVFTKLQLLDIRIKSNGKIIWQDSGDRLDKRNQYRGMTAAATMLTLDFSEIYMKELLEQKMGSLDTSAAGIESLTMEVDIGGATAPTLAAYAECSWQSTQVQQTADLIGKVLNFPHQVGASSLQYPLNIPYGKQGGSLIKRLHLFQPAAGITINGFEVRKNGITIFQSTMGINNFINTEYKHVPQAGVFTADFISDGNFMGGILNAADADTMEYYVDVTVTVAGTIQVVAEILDTMANN